MFPAALTFGGSQIGGARSYFWFDAGLEFLKPLSAVQTDNNGTEIKFDTNE